jgi:hypothetical protein
MYSRKQILAKFKQIHDIKPKYALVAKVIKAKDELDDDSLPAVEMTFEPLNINEDWQYLYTLKYIRIMYDTLGNEMIYSCTDVKQTVGIAYAETLEDLNIEACKIRDDYVKRYNFNQVVSSEEMVNLAKDCVAEYEAESDE